MAFLGLHRKPQRRVLFAVLLIFIISYYLLPEQYYPRRSQQPSGASTSTSSSSTSTSPRRQGQSQSRFDWASRKERHPIADGSMTQLPTGAPLKLPRVQHDFAADKPDAKLQAQQETRRAAVKKAFSKCWKSYREYAWGSDELRPQTLAKADTFGGWGATLVDALDTMLIMDLKDEFQDAVVAVKKIDWSVSSERGCSLFETNIRYLGGLLAAYDLSGEASLLSKALELGHMLFAAFDNKQRMPMNGFEFDAARKGTLEPSRREISAAIGSLSLEFTRLAQLTGEQKFFDAIDRITKEMVRTQSQTKMPGLWPVYINVADGWQTPDTQFTLGAMADSLYEYFPKMHALLGGLDPAYEKMHKFAVDTARRKLLFRPMVPDQIDILFTGEAIASSDGSSRLTPSTEHLGCFSGGMFGLGGRLFELKDDVAIGASLARGCAWAYSVFPTGIMPEVATLVPCDSPDLAPCQWNETIWESESRQNMKGVPKGFKYVQNRKYILRPEAIESVFILYRITGDQEWLDFAWAMFQSIQAATETEHANAAIVDVMSTDPTTNKVDSMESFWLAETLKYFYLIFSDPSLISLDEFVFNTEAHPFKRPSPG